MPLNVKPHRTYILLAYCTSLALRIEYELLRSFSEAAGTAQTSRPVGFLLLYYKPDFIIQLTVAPNQLLIAQIHKCIQPQGCCLKISCSTKRLDIMPLAPESSSHLSQLVKGETKNSSYLEYRIRFTAQSSIPLLRSRITNILQPLHRRGETNIFTRQGQCWYRSRWLLFDQERRDSAPVPGQKKLIWQSAAAEP